MAGGKLLVTLLAVCWVSVYGVEDTDEKKALAFMKFLNDEAATVHNKVTVASWAYGSNITDHNLQLRLNATTEYAKLKKEQWNKVITYKWQEFGDENLKRQFEKYSQLGMAALPDDKFRKLSEVTAAMESIYGKAKVCDFKDKTKCDLSLEPELTAILTNSKDPEELKHVWVEWRKASGQKMRQLYEEYVQLSNEGARLNNFTDLGAYWRDDFDSDSFEADIERLLNEVQPLYKELHAYVRRRLREHYGEEIFPSDGTIPAHLVGNMWAQTWSGTLGITVPYPKKESVNVTPNMVQQGYTPKKMFETANEFFTSLNLISVDQGFWEKSIIEKPKDGRDLICHASAWDFYDSQDFRIKMCTEVNQRELEVIHHELGHIQYFMQYKHQPAVFRRGANSGFHEAIGDVMSLSVSTPKHLKRIKLLSEDFEFDKEALINHLFNSAMEKVAFLPFSYLVDQWRWDVFKGDIKPSEYNCRWWKLRSKLQGISPPVPRSENDFDPGAKYHVAADVPYIRYFVSHILQFQFHKAMCILAGEFDPANPTKTPLCNCDIYRSTAAGEKLAAMLQLGSSKKSPDALEVLTGQREMSALDLLEYYRPLYDWLVEENRKAGETPGWKDESPNCPSSPSKTE